MRIRATAARLSVAILGLSFLLLASACGGGGTPFGLKSELVTKADNAAAMAFAPDGRLFFAEQVTGNIRVITAEGELLPLPFAQVEVALYLEWGLTGLALDPEFETNHFVYAYLTQPVSQDPPIGRPVVVRFVDQDNQGVDARVLIGDLPESAPEHPGYNANGKIHFGPDGFLYVSVGDYDTGDFAQDLSRPLGKLLRVNKEDGSPVADNPFANDPSADPRIFAYGFREPFDFAFHPRSGQIYGTDNTPVTCEEINIIEAGGNYGWANVGEFPFDTCGAGGQVQAIHYLAKQNQKPGDFLSFVEVSAVAFASASRYPVLGDSLLACERGTKEMRRVVLSGSNFDQATADDKVVGDCLLAVATSPDGTIYYSNDKEIRRLIPSAP